MADDASCQIASGGEQPVVRNDHVDSTRFPMRVPGKRVRR
jgi:hypothetical protein